MREVIKIDTYELKNALFYDDLINDIYSECGQYTYSIYQIDEFNAPFLENEGQTIILNISLLPTYT